MNNRSASPCDGTPQPAAKGSRGCSIAPATLQDPPSPFERLMQHARLTHIAQELWVQVVRRGDTVVDAT